MGNPKMQIDLLLFFFHALSLINFNFPIQFHIKTMKNWKAMAPSATFIYNFIKIEHFSSFLASKIRIFHKIGVRAVRGGLISTNQIRNKQTNKQIEGSDLDRSYANITFSSVILLE